MRIIRVSPITGRTNVREIPATEEELIRWNQPNPPLIQDCFPNLSPDDREFILTGTTPADWDSLFGTLEQQ